MLGNAGITSGWCEARLCANLFCRAWKDTYRQNKKRKGMLRFCCDILGAFLGRSLENDCEQIEILGSLVQYLASH